MRHGRWMVGCVAVWCAAAQAAAGADGVAATPEQDDAALHDVQFVGSRVGYAVGDRGVVWKTDDGGASWSLLSTPVACSLRSVCFLTDRIGWIVGGGVTPHVRTDWGVVLFTDDGGETWEVRAEKNVPYLHDVRFFGLKTGIAIGEASARFATGVLVTKDGGRTWRAMPGRSDAGWRTAAFVDQETGCIGGLRGGQATIGGGRILAGGARPFGLRGVRDIALQQEGDGWLAGDGGLLMQTDSAGVRWDDPPSPLPRELREMLDFHAAATRGDHVWAAGSPGSVVWHSADGGRRWERQITGDAAPIHAIHFASESQGCAVGSFGTIRITADGGRTWRTVRGGGRRVALLSITGDARATPIQLTMKLGREEGYRIAAAAVARRDVGPDGHAHETIDLRLQDAAVSAGGCETEIDWRLPVAVPGLDGDEERLVSEWRLITDGRLPEVMLGSLVAKLRTWRPDVVVINEPGEGDAAAKLVHDAVLHAARQAADPTRYPQQFELCGLEPWRVQRVFARMPAAAAAAVNVDPHQVLPRQGSTLAMAAAEPLAKLRDRADSDTAGDGYLLVWNVDGDQPDGVSVRGFFTGLGLRTGGAARRDPPSITELDFDRLEELAEHQRNFEAYAQRMLDDPRHGGQLLAQLGDIVGPAPADQAALQLWRLADQYRKRSQWELAEATLTELVERYPREAISLEAMQWLLTFWTSREVAWQRLRRQTASGSSVSTDRGVVEANVRDVQQQLRAGSSVRDAVRSQASPLLIEPAGGVGPQRLQSQQRVLEAERWLEQAQRVADQLERVSPVQFAQPEVQFVYAALNRRRGRYETSDAIYREFAMQEQSVWRMAGRGEVWMLGSPAQSPKPVYRCRRASSPPVLDGVLGDLCWQEGEEIRLRRDAEMEAVEGYLENTPIAAEPARGTGETIGRRAIVMLTYDREHLYFAASVPRRPGLPDDPPEFAGRTHDADLSGFDQLSLQLDVDRDYATYYRFDVDSRAQTRDACWTDQRYDPQWFVAADADDRRWTVEAAIPLTELSAVPPQPGEIWAAGVTRVMPTRGVAGWTVPVSSIPQPAAFGLLRFE